MKKSIESITQKACKAAYDVLVDEIDKLEEMGAQDINMQELEDSVLHKIGIWVELTKSSSVASKTLYRSIKCGCHSLEEINSLRDEAWDVHDEMVNQEHPFSWMYGESLVQFGGLLVELELDQVVGEPLLDSEIDAFITELNLKLGASDNFCEGLRESLIQQK